VIYFSEPFNIDHFHVTMIAGDVFQIQDSPQQSWWRKGIVFHYAFSTFALYDVKIGLWHLFLVLPICRYNQLALIRSTAMIVSTIKSTHRINTCFNGSIACFIFASLNSSFGVSQRSLLSLFRFLWQLFTDLLCHGKPKRSNFFTLIRILLPQRVKGYACLIRNHRTSDSFCDLQVPLTIFGLLIVNHLDHLSPTDTQPSTMSLSMFTLILTAKATMKKQEESMVQAARE